MTINSRKDEIIGFVMNSSDTDNLIIAAFIAGMQAKKDISMLDDNEKQSMKSSEQNI